jgi:hypothetical protein
MNKTDFKLFLKDISLGLFVMLFILFLCNISGVFDFNEHSSKPELMWRSLVKRDSLNTAKIIFSGNSQSDILNPIIIDSITEKSCHFFGYRGANILGLSWFFSNSWDNLNPELIVLETHSFRTKASLDNARTSIDSIRYSKWVNESPSFSKSPVNLTYFHGSQNNILNLPSFLYNNKDELVYILSPLTKDYFLIESEPNIFYEFLFPSKKDLSLAGFRKQKRVSISDSLLYHYNNDWISFPDSPIDSSVLPIVKKLIKECQSKGIQVLVYESPMYFKHFKPQIQRKKQIDSFCQQLNIPFVDLNLETSLTKKPHYFENTKAENQHLTPEGADAVSKLLANKILQLNLLSKKNNDAY